MAMLRTLYWTLVLSAAINPAILADEHASDRDKCQSGRPLRKQVNAEPINGICLRDIVAQLSRVLRSTVNDELGLPTFQNMLDAMEFTNVPSSLDVRLSLLADKLNKKLLAYIEFLKQSSNMIQPLLVEKENPSPFGSSMIELDITASSITDICSQFISVLAATMRSLDWKNLHILPLKYPGTICGPPASANNIGPLFLSQSCPNKNILLLLEHGTFMSEGDIALAQKIAKTIINTLSDRDRVNVIALSSNTSMYCRDSLIKATDINKFQLAGYIDSITRTEYNGGVDVNFGKLVQHATREMVFVHLTNTLRHIPIIDKIIDLISTGQVSGYLKTIFILSDQEPHMDLKEKIQNDSVIVLPSQNIIGYEMAKLFSDLQCSDDYKKPYYVSDPYFEQYSKTMVLSIGQITSTALLSLDVKLEDFLDDITYFYAGPNVHAMLFDGNGIVWIHKDFPRVEGMMGQPLKVYLQDIENISVEYVRNMIEQEDGSINIKTKLGHQKWYRWKHLTYKDLIVCITSTVNEAQWPVAKLIPPIRTSLLHHRLDLLLHSLVDKDILCAYQNRLLTLSTAVVYLSPWCFQSPVEQLKLLETGSAVTVQSYMAYIKDSTGLLANPGLQLSVRHDVATLAQIVEYFKSRHSKSPLNKYIIRRYVVGTVSGVLEIFPGMVLDSTFDPKSRMWYGKALEHPEKIVLTPPYLDAGGAGYITTLSQVVKHSKKWNGSSDYTIAVMAMDVTMGYVSRLLKEQFPFCNESTVKCFLMDDRGYLVSHPSLLEATGKIELQHLTHKELLVANDILNHELFVKKKACANHLDGTVQRYYQFNTSLEEVLTNIVHGEHCVKYQVTAVPGTNVFLGVVNVTCNLSRAFCPCSTMDRSCLNCKRMEQTECECPCECALYSSACVDYMIQHIEPCAAPYEQGGAVQMSWAQSKDLKTCPSSECKAYKTEADCLGIVGCQWCYIDSDGEAPLQSPFCSDNSFCFRGVIGSLIPYSDGTYNSQSTDDVAIKEWPSVGPVAGGILAFLLILGVALFCYRLRSVQSGLEHQCLHLHTSPDTLRMTHLDGDIDPMELDPTKNNLDARIRDGIAPISPYRVSSNYRKPPGGDSDHGYSTMTPHDDSEQQTFAEPLLVVGSNTEPDLRTRSICLPSPTTHLGPPHHVLAPVTVHCNMETNYC